jgi:hypothetical protein
MILKEMKVKLMIMFDIVKLMISIKGNQLVIVNS